MELVDYRVSTTSTGQGESTGEVPLATSTSGCSASPVPHALNSIHHPQPRPPSCFSLHGRSPWPTTPVQSEHRPVTGVHCHWGGIDHPSTPGPTPPSRSRGPCSTSRPPPAVGESTPSQRGVQLQGTDAVNFSLCPHTDICSFMHVQHH